MIHRLIMRDRLEQLAAGDLPAGQREAVERHAAACPECAERLRRLRRLQQAFASERAEAQGEGPAFERVWAEAALDSGQRHSTVRLIATGAAALAIAGWLLWRPAAPPRPAVARREPVPVAGVRPVPHSPRRSPVIAEAVAPRREPILRRHRPARRRAVALRLAPEPANLPAVRVERPRVANLPPGGLVVAVSGVGEADAGDRIRATVIASPAPDTWTYAAEAAESASDDAYPHRAHWRFVADDGWHAYVAARTTAPPIPDSEGRGEGR